MGLSWLDVTCIFTPFSSTTFASDMTMLARQSVILARKMSRTCPGINTVLVITVHESRVHIRYLFPNPCGSSRRETFGTCRIYFKNIGVLTTMQLPTMAEDEPVLNITTEAFSGRSKTKSKLNRSERVSLVYQSDNFRLPCHWRYTLTCTDDEI